MVASEGRKRETMAENHWVPLCITSKHTMRTTDAVIEDPVRGRLCFAAP